MGSMFSNSLMWLEQFLPVKNRVASIFTAAAAVGFTAAPLILGKRITSFFLEELQDEISLYTLG